MLRMESGHRGPSEACTAQRLVLSFPCWGAGGAPTGLGRPTVIPVLEFKSLASVI